MLLIPLALNALTLGLFLCSEGAELLEPPHSKSVQFNEGATFVCVGIGDALFWILDGTALDSPNQEKGVTFTDSGSGSTVPGLLSSELTINVTDLSISYGVISRGIGISCQIVTWVPFDEVFSETAMLSVTGISPPRNIFLSGDWILRFSNQIYRPRDALLNNLTFDVRVNGEVIIANTTKTSVQLHPFCNNPTEVKIIAYIGPYHSSTSVLFENVIEERTIKILNYTTLVNGTECSVTLNILVDTQSCGTLVAAKLFTSEGDVKNYPPLLLNFSDRNVTVPYIINGLQTCLSYDAEMSVLNTSNFTEDTDNITIESLHSDLMGIEINQNEDGSISVQCIYSKMSSANGCHVTFTHTTTGYNESCNIKGSDNATIFLSTGGVYAIAVYDINNDGSIAPWTCVQPKQVNVTLRTTTPSFNGDSSTVSSVSSSAVTSVITTLSPSVTVETESSSDIIFPSTTSTFSSNQPTGTTNNTGAYTGSTFAVALAFIIITVMIIIVMVLYYKRKRKKSNEEEPHVRLEAEVESDSTIQLGPIIQKTNVSLQDKLDQESSTMQSETGFNDQDCYPSMARDPYVSPDSPKNAAKEDLISHNNYDGEPVADNFMAVPSSPLPDKGPLIFVPTHEVNFTKIVDDGTVARSAIENVDPLAQVKDVKESPD